MSTLDLSAGASALSEDSHHFGLFRGALLLLAGLGAGLFLVVTQGLPLDTGRYWIADGGPVQTATFALLAASSLLAAALAVLKPLRRTDLVLAALMLGVYAAREFDLHKATWMPENFTSVRLYSAADVPLWQKLGCGLLMLSIIVVALSLVARTAPRILPDLKARRMWVSFAGAWLCVFAASQLSDDSALNGIFAGQAFEEIAECVAAGFVVLTVYWYPRGDR
jgi:hypothetical protein